MYGGVGVPQALPLPVQGDVGRQLRVFWTGAEGQQVSGLATVVQEAAGMANVRFTEGGEDRWYTLRKDSMTIAEDGSNFEWADRTYPSHAAYVAACPPHPKSTRNRPYLDGQAAAAAAARKGRPAVHKGGYVVSGGAAAEYMARHMALQGAVSVAAAAASAVANANTVINAASVVEAQACDEGGDNGGGGGRGGGDDGAFIDESDSSDDSDRGGDGGTGPALPNVPVAFPQLRKLEIGAPVCRKRLLGSATARHSPAQPGLLGRIRLVPGRSTHSPHRRAQAAQIATRGCHATISSCHSLSSRTFKTQVHHIR